MGYVDGQQPCSRTGSLIGKASIKLEEWGANPYGSFFKKFDFYKIF